MKICDSVCQVHGALICLAITITITFSIYCIIQQATREKRDLEVKKIVLANSLVNLTEDGESLATELALANGDVTTYTSVLATLSPGKTWDEYDDKLATATYRLRVLNKRAGKKGGEAQIDHELDLADLDAMVANRSAVIEPLRHTKPRCKTPLLI